MRAVALLLLPGAVALALVFVAVRVISDKPAPSVAHPTSIVWANRVFVNKDDLARWLRSRGADYDAWARQHPALAAGAMRPPTTTTAAPARATGSSVGVRRDLLFGVAAALAVGLLVLLSRRLPKRVARPALPSLEVVRRDVHRTSHTALHRRAEVGWIVAAAGLAITLVALLPRL